MLAPALSRPDSRLGAPTECFRFPGLGPQRQEPAALNSLGYAGSAVRSSF